jgi:hypothetical protein
VEQEGRPSHGRRRRCSDPKEKGCRGWARRGSNPATCYHCGGGTRAQTRHDVDPDTGQSKPVARGLISVPPRVQALLDGTLDISELDEEELARGYPRAADGSFRNPPVVIPRAIHARMMRELFDRANRTLKENLTDAANTMVTIMGNPELDPKIRLDASKWLIERIMGKTPDIQVNVDEKAYERLFERLERDAEPVVVDGEVLNGYEP